MKRAQTLAAVLIGALCFSGTSHSQEYPNKLVRIVVGFGPGGSIDILARLISQKLSETWGQTVIIENRPGAGGTIGADLVAKAQPDGYTLLVGDIGANAVAGSLYPQLPYDPYRDFAHVTLLVVFPLVIVVPSAAPMSSVKALIDQAKAKPGAIKYSTAGAGSSPHLFLEMMSAMAGIKTEPIHYKGAVPALTGLLTGDVDYTAMSVSTASVQIAAGKVRPIAVTSTRPTTRLPNVPPVASAVPGYEALTFHGFHAPLKTPRPIVTKLNEDVIKAMQRPDVKERLDALGIDIATNSPEEFTAFLKKQIDLWTPIVRNANIRAD